MTVHRPHPLTGPDPYSGTRYEDPADGLLYDNCDRCAEQATDPFRTLDTDRLGALWRRMVEVERTGGHYRTAAEGQACRRLYAVACMVERTHPMLMPWTWPWAIYETSPAVARSETP